MTMSFLVTTPDMGEWMVRALVGFPVFSRRSTSDSGMSQKLEPLPGRLHQVLARGGSDAALGQRLPGGAAPAGTPAAR